MCAKDRFVSRIRFNLTAETSHPFVNFIELTCTPIAGGTSNTLCIQTGQGCPAAGAFVQTCPTGMSAIGIGGRTGTYVDALELVCGPKPAPMSTSAQWGIPPRMPVTLAMPGKGPNEDKQVVSVSGSGDDRARPKRGSSHANPSRRPRSTFAACCKKRVCIDVEIARQ